MELHIVVNEFDRRQGGAARCTCHASTTSGAALFENMSEADKANIAATTSGDLSRSQPQEMITVDNHQPHMSVDELLKAIKGANGMPVLFVPSSDGRLAAVAVDGLHQNLVPTNSFSDKKNQQDFRAWLLLLTSLVATVTFTAGLAPPGGFWDTDDKTSGRIAGTSIMRDKLPLRYSFYYSNTTAFFASLMIIGMLAKNVYNKETVVLKNRVFVALVGLCFLSLGTSYITGTWVSPRGAVYNIVAFVVVVCYMSMHWVVDSIVWMRRRAT